MKQIHTIAFDADDTLWVNETYFHETELQFCQLLSPWLSPAEASKRLFDTEMKNLSIYGYGIKGFILCMIETITQITTLPDNTQLIAEILALGHQLLEKPVELLPGVLDTLEYLSGKYTLILATKGDLLDQERKLNKSGISGFFKEIEIMSDKKPANYRRLLENIDCHPQNFLMVGNSVKSDILPVLQLNGHAAHIPFHTTWAHEIQDEEVTHPNYIRLDKIDEIISLLKK